MNPKIDRIDSVESKSISNYISLSYSLDEQLRQNPSYLEWLKSQRRDGQSPLVVGGGAGGGETPFISISTAGNGSMNGTTTE